MTTTESASRNLDQLLAEAGRRYMNRQYEQAGQLYAELTAHPRYAAEGTYGLGMVALAHGDLTRAQTHLQQTLHRSPQHHRAIVGLGLIAERQGHATLARQHYGRAAALGNRTAVDAVRRLDAAAAARARMATRPSAPPPPAARQAAAPPPAAAPPAMPRSAGPPRNLARQPSGRGIIGQVSALQARQEPRGPRQRPKLVVTFRVERPGQPPAPVELRGEVLKGSISQGDWVEVPPRLARGRSVDAFYSFTTFWNLTTGTKVRMAYTASTVIGLSLGWGLLAAVVTSLFMFLMDA